MILRLPRLLVVSLLRAYRAVVSPLYGPTCRFYPSCSEYALIAVERHGVIRGGWLAGRRLLRCHPWNPGGVDPVPPLESSAESEGSAEPDSSAGAGGSAESGDESAVSVDTTPAPSSFRRVA